MSDKKDLKIVEKSSDFCQSEINEGVLKGDADIKHLTDISQIVPYVLVSNWQTSCVSALLDTYRIRHILCIAEHEKKKKELDMYQAKGIQHTHIQLEDNHGADMSKHFDIIYQAILTAKNSKQNILVHCVSGISRSPAAILLGLVRMAYAGAVKPAGPIAQKILDAMLLKRPVIDILPTFMDQIRAEEARLRGSQALAAPAAIKPTVFGAPTGEPRK